MKIWKDYRLGVSGDRQEETYGRNKIDTNKGQPMAKVNAREKLHRRVQRFFVAMSQTFERVTLISTLYHAKDLKMILIRPRMKAYL